MSVSEYVQKFLSEADVEAAIIEFKKIIGQYIDLAASRATTRELEYDYGGDRAGCKYYVKVVDKESILKIKELIQ